MKINNLLSGASLFDATSDLLKEAEKIAESTPADEGIAAAKKDAQKAKDKKSGKRADGLRPGEVDPETGEIIE